MHPFKIVHGGLSQQADPPEAQTFSPPPAASRQTKFNKKRELVERLKAEILADWDHVVDRHRQHKRAQQREG